MRRSRPFEERFREKVVVTPEGCWRWTGFIDKPGYGRIKQGGRGTPVLHAHRLSYEMAKGPVPPGLELDHVCRNRWCVNPDHLQAVTHRENARRALQNTMLLVGKCRRGHDVETYGYARRDRPGTFNCTECIRENQRRRYREDADYRAKAKTDAAAHYRKRVSAPGS